ncbi:hypothetical protein ASPCAL08667 [Aspergillus calidoustus]|uniref:SMP-30/Gluconolactonase/LRE-like region domain-containing protein n=1 Tax=Aspergillus calidoustus TaxID=454130 RepID=A0A0U5A1F5_ASPCI|nr:hypothetical protein ASPCAL08667 [Aspergillus calidoustus]
MATKFATATFLLALGATALENATFITYQPAFKDIIGENPKLELILQNKTYPFAHEAPVYIPETGDVFIVGNYQTKTGGQPIQISKIRSKNDVYVREQIFPDIPMANGAVNYEDGVLFASQGTIERPSALIYMDPEPPYSTEVVLDSFNGRRFNGLNDVVIHSDGSIWFTDPTYAYDQGFAPKPDLPHQVYRFDPGTGSVRAVADGLGQPNGLAFSPDESILYVTDTDSHRGNGDNNPERAATIYAYDVATYAKSPFLINRRVFAYADNGIPDGVKVDTNGNVYSGCGDGVHVWSAGGDLLGKIKLPDVSANFCFAEAGEMYILNEYRVWKATLSEDVHGALLGL